MKCCVLAVGVAASAAHAGLTFHNIDLGAVANHNLASGGSTNGGLYPTGNLTLGDVPFTIAAQGNNIWHSVNVAGENPHFANIDINVFGVDAVHTLVNNWWGVAGPDSFAWIEFTGSDGAFFVKEFVGNSDIRDHNERGFTNLINGTTTIEVFNTGAGQRLDKQFIDLPDDFNDETLVSATIVDSGGDFFQRIWLAGLTVWASEEAAPCPWDCANGDGQVGIADFLLLLQFWGDTGAACDLGFGGPGIGIEEFLGLLKHWGSCP